MSSAMWQKVEVRAKQHGHLNWAVRYPFCIARSLVDPKHDANVRRMCEFLEQKYDEVEVGAPA